MTSQSGDTVTFGSGSGASGTSTQIEMVAGNPTPVSKIRRSAHVHPHRQVNLWCIKLSEENPCRRWNHSPLRSSRITHHPMRPREDEQPETSKMAKRFNQEEPFQVYDTKTLAKQRIGWRQKCEVFGSTTDGRSRTPPIQPINIWI